MDLYEEYAALVERIKKMTARKDEIKAQLVATMREGDLAAVECANHVVKISPRSKMTVSDAELIAYLQSKGISPEAYEAPKVCHTKLQALIASGDVDAAEIAEFVRIEPYDVLLVIGKGKHERP